jgi:hypothetical protein
VTINRRRDIIADASIRYTAWRWASDQVAIANVSMIHLVIVEVGQTWSISGMVGRMRSFRKGE